ncbi:MAG: DnaD domain protein [Coprobacillus sp.]|nr:DnaD domain protein [Coprobacillus sp.]
MVTDGLDFSYLLLENYKDLKISEDELAVILMIDHLISQDNPLITADLLSLKMNLDVSTIDSLLASLLKKHYIEYVTTWRGTVTTLDPLQEILFSEFEFTSAKKKTSKKLQELPDNIYTKIEKELSRTLSPVEVDKISGWLALGHTEEMILDAVKEAVKRNKKSLREVDKILLSWEKKADQQKEGVSALSDKWDKNIDETIEIAKTPWLDIDDD